MSPVAAPIASHAAAERFAADYTRYRGELEERVAALYRSVDEHTREDWCEQAWEALWKHELAHGRDGYDSPMKFLLGVVRDRCTDWLRSPKSATAAVNPMATLWAALEDEERSTERAAEVRISDEEARSVLGAMRPGDARVVVLSVCYGWPVAAVCAELGINRKRYERSLTRGLRTAAELMAERRGEAWLEAVERLAEQIRLEEADQRRLQAALMLDELDDEVHEALVSCGHLAHALGAIAPADLLLRSQGSSLLDRAAALAEGGLERVKEGATTLLGRTSQGAEAATSSAAGAVKLAEQSPDVRADRGVHVTREQKLLPYDAVTRRAGDHQKVIGGVECHHLGNGARRQDAGEVSQALALDVGALRVEGPVGLHPQLRQRLLHHHVATAPRRREHGVRDTAREALHSHVEAGLHHAESLEQVPHGLLVELCPRGDRHLSRPTSSCRGPRRSRRQPAPGTRGVRP